MAQKRITPKELLSIVESEFELASQNQIGKFLHLTQGRVSQIRTSKGITSANIKALLRGAFKAGQKSARSATNNLILNSFKELRNIDTQSKLAKAIGKTQPAVAQWKNGTAPATRKLIDTVLRSAVKLTITPLCEMEPVDPGKPGGKWYLFNDPNGIRRGKLQKKIGTNHGIYCYYDGRGNLTYIGKADKTDLFGEIESRLNAKIAKERIRYGQGLAKRKTDLKQGDLVKFISAYAVSPQEVIPLSEAILIRVTANSQFNNRLENL